MKISQSGWSKGFRLLLFSFPPPLLTCYHNGCPFNPSIVRVLNKTNNQGNRGSKDQHLCVRESERYLVPNVYLLIFRPTNTRVTGTADWRTTMMGSFKASTKSSIQLAIGADGKTFGPNLYNGVREGVIEGPLILLGNFLDSEPAHGVILTCYDIQRLVPHSTPSVDRA